MFGYGECLVMANVWLTRMFGFDECLFMANFGYDECLFIANLFFWLYYRVNPLVILMTTAFYMLLHVLQ